MSRFYGHWLGDSHGDAAAALRETQRNYLDEERRRAQARAQVHRRGNKDRAGIGLSAAAGSGTARPAAGKLVKVGRSIVTDVRRRLL